MTHHEALERENYLRKTIEENPDYAGILPLFIAICEYLRENGGEAVAFALPDDAESRIRSGQAALTEENMVVDGPAATAFLQGLAERMMSVGIGEAAQFRNFRYLTPVETPRLLQAWFRGQRGVLQSAGFRLRINPGVLETLLGVPVKEAAAKAAAAIPPEWHAAWHGLTCPVCASEPAMAELRGDDGKILSCSVCRTDWRLSRVACPLCGNDDTEKLSHFLIEGDYMRVDVCTRCHRYIKTRDTTLGNDNIPLDLLDITTMHLDILAERHGFSRT